VINANRSRFRRRRVAEELHADLTDRLTGQRPGPGEGGAGHDGLLKALDQLGPRQRAVIVLRYWLDDPVDLAAGWGSGPHYAFVGQAAKDLDYVVVTFTDGQQIKLVPLTAVMVRPPLDLWLKPGQAAPPRATAVIGRGPGDGTPWTATAYEGPWGTCVVDDSVGTECLPSARLAGTQLLGWVGQAAGTTFGSAAPGLTLIRFTLSDRPGRPVTQVNSGGQPAEPPVRA
jgi:hypothetical protein